MQYQIGQYILDTDERVLLKERDRSVISNHDRIIEVLIILAKEHPRAVPRAELLEAVWPTKEVTDWALSRLIADIRRLFEENGEKDQILKTVHGVGFRLAVPVAALANQERVEKSTPTPSNSKRRTMISGAAVGLVLLIALVVFFVENPEITTSENTVTPDEDPRFGLQGQRWDRTEKIEVLPFSKGWSTTNGLEIDFQDGASFSPTTAIQKMGYEYLGPVNLNNALVLLDISVTQEYIDSGAAVQPYAILLFDKWRGEWNCVIENSALSTERKTYECKLDEPGAIFNIAADKSMRIGVQSLADGPITGTITVHQVKILHAPSFVDHGWLASDNLPVTYDGGVQYMPRDGGERLEFKYSGPENLQGATIVFTIEASQEYIDSGSTILPYAQKLGGYWLGEWSCWTPNSALSPVGSRIECQLDEPGDIFNLTENESLLIGIMSQRGERRMDGTIKIKNVEIIFP